MKKEKPGSFAAALLPKRLPRNAIIFSLVSFLNDVSSEMIFPILPIFFTTVLGAPAFVVGMMEGVAHTLETLFRGASGYYSDRQKKRRPLVISGYGISALAKPAFAFAGGWPFALAVRSIDRVGKGMRVTARDAMLAEDSRGPDMGKVFGVRKMADSAGAVAGPIITFAILAYAASSIPLEGTYRLIFLLSFIPAAAGVALLFFLREKARTASREPIFAAIKETLLPPPGPWRSFLGISAVFGLGNISYAFFILAASDAGASPAVATLLYVLFNIFYMLFAVPAGALTGKIGSKKMLLATFLSYAAVCAIFAAAPLLLGGALGANFAGVPFFPLALGFAMYGIFSACYETVARIYIAEHFPNKRLGSALGAYNIVLGMLALPSGLLAGILYPLQSPQGASMAFIFGGLCAVCAAVGTLVYYRHGVHVVENPA